MVYREHEAPVRVYMDHSPALRLTGSTANLKTRANFTNCTSLNIPF